MSKDIVPTVVGVYLLWWELKCPSDGDWHVEDLQSELIHPKEGDMEASLSPTLPSNANTMLNEHESDKTTQASYKYTGFVLLDFMKVTFVLTYEPTLSEIKDKVSNLVLRRHVSKLCSDNGCGMDDTDSWWSRVQIAGIVVLVVLGLCLLLFLYTLSMGTVKYFIRLFKRTVIRNETAFHNCSSGSLTNVSNCLTSPNSSPSTQLKSNRGFISDPHCTHDTLNRPAVKEYNSGQETLERPPIPPREHVSSVQSQRQTQRIPFSLDLLPEPPSISVDEIRRLNSVFNQFL
ncbi:hypothetical protein DdX_06950 [Ditylenchus destructor]|uniref:Uncharacterized protein n=1 Tax=Ditylenchus destructor TaxID=166010 RepID=A0AAD4NAI5_9BILA|nr:hypothetical protein DdX_06950 [Ditylenchus destructor]